MGRHSSKLKQFMAVFLHHFQMAQISASAAVLAYYTLLSIFPAILVVGNLLPMIGVDANTVLSYLQTAVPSSVFSFIKPIVYDFLSNGSGGMLTTGAIIALWSTSQGIAAFQRSVNHAYGVAENQNPIINRTVSFVWMLVVILILFLMAFTYGIGEDILQKLQPIFRFNVAYVKTFAQLKWPVTFLSLFIALTLLYYFVPNARVRLRYVVVGAVIVALLWMGLSRVFSMYAQLLNRRITSYRTIGAFIAMMIWLDFSGMLVMIGATINATLQEEHEGEIVERRHLIQWIRDTRNQGK
ncbi:YihY/virulence factor BrkB family protein [Limosilactobacillus coleohominis]|jgi:membrane protein|uniref:YihY/virulence factor BrkB family protein n=1 Tax=Limosilactobacillus coleohominis TaxID=181675 RepID=UPI0015B8EDD2|nr:YhjD/YihY/BrkB family envelope integrity protein [Limosilactobacillus coleohominis]MDY5628121.1 YihY/virulence factor BrkB family protein [Limosilactobacillus coleohominis]